LVVVARVYRVRSGRRPDPRARLRRRGWRGPPAQPGAGARRGELQAIYWFLQRVAGLVASMSW